VKQELTEGEVIGIMSSSSSEADFGGGGRRLVAEMPVFLSQANRDRQKAPQKKIDEFWKKFTTKAPGKGKLHQTSPAQPTWPSRALECRNTRLQLTLASSNDSPAQERICREALKTRGSQGGRQWIGSSSIVRGGCCAMPSQG